MKITFECDEEKAKKNLRKHKINFAEAKTIFNDSFLLTFPDREYRRNPFRPYRLFEQ